MSEQSDTRRRMDVRRLLRACGLDDVDAATEAVLSSAMATAIDVTHECGTPERTDAAILDTFGEAIRRARYEMGGTP